MRKRIQEPSDPFLPPPYPTDKVYYVDEEEGVDLGVPSPEDMVLAVNKGWALKRRLPITQHDYPTTRKKFLKLVGWWKDLKAEEDAKSLEAVPKEAQAGDGVVPTAYSRANYVAAKEAAE